MLNDDEESLSDDGYETLMPPQRLLSFPLKANHDVQHTFVVSFLGD